MSIDEKDEKTEVSIGTSLYHFNVTPFGPIATFGRLMEIFTAVQFQIQPGSLCNIALSRRPYSGACKWNVTIVEILVREGIERRKINQNAVNVNQTLDNICDPFFG